MKKDSITLLLFIFTIVMLAAFICFAVLSYTSNCFAFEILKDVSITLAVTFNFSFTFRIIKVNFNNSFNNNKIIINKGTSNHDEQLASKIEKALENIKKTIRREESYTQEFFYSDLYRISEPVLSNFNSPKFIFESFKLQEIFDSIRNDLSKLAELYKLNYNQMVSGEMAKKYISIRNDLSKHIDDFYLELANKED